MENTTQHLRLKISKRHTTMWQNLLGQIDDEKAEEYGNAVKEGLGGID